MADTGGITFEDLMEAATAREISVRVLLNQQMLERQKQLEAELQETLNVDARENRDPLGPGLAQQLQEYEAEIDAAMVTFTFRSIGRKAWVDLLAQHPPTKEQQRIARVDHNPETFPPVAVVASCISPKITLAGLNAAMDAGKISEGQFQQLWQGCIDANLGGSSGTPKSLLASSILRVNDALLKLPQNSEPPDLSSLDE